jgi:hypothetical protein
MPKPFDPSGRISLEQHPGGKLNGQVLDQIRVIEQKAKQAREAGQDPREATRDDVVNLETAAAQAYAQQAEYHKEVIDDARRAFERERDRRPEQELTRIRRAENRINALSDAEIRELAMNYADGAELTDEEARVVASRLNRSGQDAEYQMHRESMKQRHVDAPWLRDPDVQVVATEMHRYQQTPPGSVVSGEDQVLAIESLVDFDNELES